MKIKLTTLFVLLIVAVIVSACGSAPAETGEVTSVFTEAEATAIAENALHALNAGDYAAWSRDWDDALKGAIHEEAFLQYREQALAQTGQFQSILSAEMAPSKRADSVRWIFTCQFEKAKVRFIMAFPKDGRLANTVTTEAAE
jgi:hypothetical protein